MAGYSHSQAPRAEGKTEAAEALLKSLDDYVSYNSLSGEFVVIACKKWGKLRVGDRAATPAFYRGKPHRKVMSIGGRLWGEHHLVWLWHTGEFIDDDLQLDHINRDPFDNRIKNLRIVTNQVNQQNRSKARNNTSNVTGVAYSIRWNKYLAYANFNKKRHSAGWHETVEEAAAARQALIQRLNAQGASFTDTHGED